MAFKKYLKEQQAAASTEALKKEDWDALLQYNRHTGRLNLHSTKVIKNPDTIHRLLANKMILSDGTLTKSAKQKCADSTRKFKITGDSSVAASEQDNDIRQDAEVSTEYENPRGSDRAALMEYDRNAGNLLKDDPETGQLDNLSREIFEDPDLIQRLIDKKMITSGGWLTAEAKREREKREQKLKNLATDRAIEKDKQENRITTPHVTEVIKKIKKTEKSAKAADSKHSYKEKFEAKRAAPEKQERPFDAPQKVYGKTPIDSNLVSLLEPQSFEAEQFKLLRTNLLYPVSGNAPRSILVTGPSPGEGKSFVAINLAISVALNIDRYVLLMDCDLRRPAIHERFGFGKVPGLSEYLSKGTTLHSLLLKTKVDRLTILPGGTPPLNPSELMSSERMSTLVEEVTNRYSDRLIIIDSPPPPLTAETGVIARHVDGIILVVRHRKTNLDVLRKMIERLGKEKILGCVVNHFEVSSLGYYGYRNYGKNRSYYWEKTSKD
jgi:exopolysaccharide/PEP-CTERM locus tyrosine autokinase